MRDDLYAQLCASVERARARRVYTRRVYRQSTSRWWREYTWRGWLIITLWLAAIIAAIVVGSHIPAETCPPGMDLGALGGVPWLETCHPS